MIDDIFFNIAEILRPTSRSYVEFHHLTPRGARHLLTSARRRCCHRLQMKWYFSRVFLMLQGCYKSTLPLTCGRVSADYESRAILFHIGEMLSSAYRGDVSVMTWSKRLQVIGKVMFFIHMREIFPSSPKRNVIMYA